MFFRASLITAILAAGAVVAGIGFAALAQADTDDEAFIQTLDRRGLQYGGAEKAILVAKTNVCGQLDATPGETLNNVVGSVADNTNWSIADSGFFTGAAIMIYCPQYKSLVDREPAPELPPPTPGPVNPGLPIVDPLIP